MKKKRGRAIDEIHRFCQYAVEQERNGKNWLEVNEDLKDFIYYYFNSKYAREGYRVNDEGFSLLDDTSPSSELGTFELVEKYLRVVDDDLQEASSPKDNIKHLQGAIRLISRGLLETNPALSILNMFCIAFMGMQSSETLKKEAVESLCENGFYLLYKRGVYSASELLERLNWFTTELCRRTDMPQSIIDEISSQVRRALHAANLKTIIDYFTQGAN